MWQNLLKFALTFVLERLLRLITKKWDEYVDDKKRREDIKKKVQRIKDAKTKEEIRSAVRDLSI